MVLVWSWPVLNGSGLLHKRLVQTGPRTAKDCLRLVLNGPSLSPTTLWSVLDQFSPGLSKKGKKTGPDWTFKHYQWRPHPQCCQQPLALPSAATATTQLHPQRCWWPLPYILPIPVPSPMFPDPVLLNNNGDDDPFHLPALCQWCIPLRPPVMLTTHFPLSPRWWCGVSHLFQLSIFVLDS